MLCLNPCLSCNIFQKHASTQPDSSESIDFTVTLWGCSKHIDSYVQALLFGVQIGMTVAADINQHTDDE